jgi:hypothetical protein
MAKVFPIKPAHPERVCWGCDNSGPADAMQCGNGSERTQHPSELFGDDWARTGLDPYRPEPAASTSAPDPSNPNEECLPSSA